MKNVFYSGRAALSALAMLLTFAAPTTAFSQLVAPTDPSVFFYEDFNHGIPAGWTSASATPGAKFVFCDSTCLQGYGANIARFYSGVASSDQYSGSDFLKGSAALQTLRQKGINGTLTSPPINCTGKSQVFIQFFSAFFTGQFPDDSIAGQFNQETTCKLRVSSDGATWKEYTIFPSSLNGVGPFFINISDAAANQNKVFIQFRRTGDQDNAVWAVDDVTLLSAAPLRRVTVSVDMSNEKISPKGVYVANDLNGWKPNAIKMTDSVGAIFKAEMLVPQSTTVHYKFMNGDSWGENESVPQACGGKNAQGYYDRVAAADLYDFIVPTVCFGACTQCGNRKPQIDYFYCPRDPNVIFCENFESYQYGKLLPQSTHWTTGSLLGGVPLKDATDIPDVVGYWDGAVNYDGSRALRIQTMYTPFHFDNPILFLGSPKEGKYQIDFKIYMPKGNSANIAIDDTLNFNHFSLSFTRDSLYVIDSLFRTIRSKSTPKALKANDWNDVALIFDASTKQITVRLNGEQVFSAIVPAQANFNVMDLSTIDAIGRRLSEGDFYIDDFVYRRLPNTATLQPQTVAQGFGVFPNPANQNLTIAPELKMNDAWQARLVNSLGQVVWSGKGENVAELRVETGDLQTGLYIVDIQSATDRWTKKVTIQH